jgi:hypothetical protein
MGFEDPLPWRARGAARDLLVVDDARMLARAVGDDQPQPAVALDDVDPFDRDLLEVRGVVGRREPEHAERDDGRRGGRGVDLEDPDLAFDRCVHVHLHSWRGDPFEPIVPRTRPPVTPQVVTRSAWHP